MGSRIYLLLLPLLITTFSSSVFLNTQYENVYVDISESGLTEVTHIVTVENITTQIRLLAKPIDELMIVTDEDGIPVSYTLNDTLMVAETYGVEKLNITYLTYGIVGMVEGLWYVKFSSTSSCEIILPKGSNIVYMNIIPEELEVVDGRIRVLMPPGFYEVHYVILPRASASPPKTQPYPTSYPSTPKTTLQHFLDLQLFLLSIITILAFIFLLYFVMKTKSRVKLSGVEQLILDYLRSRGGAYQDDIAKDLKLPKSTVSRALNNLVKNGLIEVRKVARRNYVKLK